MKQEQTIPFYHTDHGPEIFPVRRSFTVAERKWRQQVVAFLLNRFQNQQLQVTEPLVLRETKEDYKTRTDVIESQKSSLALKGKELRNQVMDILLPLRIINEILKILYGSPDWGNQPHVIDELVYILLTRRSKIEDARKHFHTIKSQFSDWKAVAYAPPEELKAAIMGGGFEDTKIRNIQTSLQAICKQLGRIDEEDFILMIDAKLYEFLVNLPGIGPKSAACILMYVRNANVFPADTHCIRVLDRLGLFKAFGFEWSQIDHKQAEQELFHLIPPEMRSDLHRNLLALGRDLCKPNKPLCEACELKKFCAFYRAKQQQHYAQIDAPLAIEMFCGAGGFSLGLVHAGFKMVAAIDKDPDAIRTYRLNHPELADEAIMEKDAREVNVEDLKLLLNGKRLDLLAGGPPCQGFSMMGNRIPHKTVNGGKKFGSEYKFVDDERNHLYEVILNTTKALRPRYVVIENVPGLDSAEIEEKSYAEQLKSLCYHVYVARLEALNFGVPQARHRYFIVGSHIRWSFTNNRKPT